MNHYGHAVYELTYHVIFVTKYRRKVLTPEMRECLKERLTTLLKKFKGTLVEFNGEEDHVHLLVQLPPQCNLSTVINSMKTQSSRTVYQRFGEELSKTYSGNLLWTASYFVITTGGANIETLKRYIEEQGTEKHARKYEKTGKYKKEKRR